MFFCSPWLKWILLGAGGLGGFLATRKKPVPAIKIGATSGAGGLGFLIGWLLEKKCLESGGDGGGGGGGGEYLPQSVPPSTPSFPYQPQGATPQMAPPTYTSPPTSVAYPTPPTSTPVYPKPPEDLPSTSFVPGTPPASSSPPSGTSTATPPSSSSSVPYSFSAGGGGGAAPRGGSSPASGNVRRGATLAPNTPTSPPLSGVRTRSSNYFRGAYGS